MGIWLTAYAAGLIACLGLDLLWLGVVARSFYQAQLGDLLAPQPNLAVAAVFYLLYPAGVLFFAVAPGLSAGSWQVTALRAALLGVLAYGTYDITNLATIKGFTAAVALADIAWGAVVTTALALAAHAAANWAQS